MLYSTRGVQRARLLGDLPPLLAASNAEISRLKALRADVDGETLLFDASASPAYSGASKPYAPALLASRTGTLEHSCGGISFCT